MWLKVPTKFSGTIMTSAVGGRMQYPVTVRETILLLIAVDSVSRFDQDLQETETLKELSSYITQAHAHGKRAKEGGEREECTGKKEAWNEHRKKNKIKLKK